MLEGLIWFGPFDTKSLCPHRWLADFEFDGNSSTRLFPLSATNRFPFWSTFTSDGPDSELGDTSGNTPVLGVMVEKSDWPSTLLAGPPSVVPSGNTRTRLSFATATYRRRPSTA